ncbi:MAG TPA: hypothetical protein VF842_11285 [Flavobacterium sp.]
MTLYFIGIKIVFLGVSLSPVTRVSSVSSKCAASFTVARKTCAMPLGLFLRELAIVLWSGTKPF